MRNGEIAQILEEVGDLLEIRNENPFRIRAYRNAARSVETLTTPVTLLVEEGQELTKLPGIGKEMAGHLREMVETGGLSYRSELLAEIPATLLDLVKLPGVGPKKAHRVWKELEISTIDALEAAAATGQLAALTGFGAKTEQKILAGIQDFRQHSARILLSEAERLVEPLLDYLRAVPQVEILEVAGSYRRRRETIGDIDLLAVAADAPPVMEAFRAYPGVREVAMAGETRSSILLGSGLQVDLRVVPRDCYGAALLYFTGSKEHNVKLRRRAVERGLTISEYGIFELEAEPSEGEGERPLPGRGRKLGGREEEEVYRAVGLPWIAPELREDRGEIESALAGALPRLIDTGDIRGDLHMHSTWSDGKSTIEEMVEACAARGYDYMVISDHSKALAMTNGLDAARLREQWREIEEVRERHPEIRILRAMEVDILGDGSLDLEDEMLEELDLVLVSIHSKMDLEPGQQTERVLRALEHPQVNVFCHPTARLINRRKPVEMDLETVLRRAAELGVAVELNAQPRRLDLKDTHLMRARELGCKIVISTDAHHTRDLALMRHGIDQARRAGLRADDVLNTRPFTRLREEFLRA